MDRSGIEGESRETKERAGKGGKEKGEKEWWKERGGGRRMTRRREVPL